MKKRKEEATAGSHDRLQSRRELLINAAVIGTGLAASSLSWAASSDRPNSAGNVVAGGAMQKRRLGSLEVSALGAGCMSISANYGPPAERSQGC